MDKINATGIEPLALHLKDSVQLACGFIDGIETNILLRREKVIVN